MSLFENDSFVQSYHSKEDFLKGFESLQNQAKEKFQEIFKEERKEITRIIKEFDYKNYSGRYYIDCETVLCSLIGAVKANKELIRHGMSNKMKI